MRTMKLAGVLLVLLVWSSLVVASAAVIAVRLAEGVGRETLEVRVSKLEECRKGCCSDGFTDTIVLKPIPPPPSPSGCTDKGKGPCGCSEAKTLREKPKLFFGSCRGGCCLSWGSVRKPVEKGTLDD